MQNLKVSELFKNIKSINNIEFETNDGINLDFENIETIDMKAVSTLLNVQKVAVLNNKSLTISNIKPNVSKTLDIIGLNKTFANVVTNPINRK